MDNPDLEKELSSLPKEKWWGDDYLCQVGGFWLWPQFVTPVNRVNNHFKPLLGDVIIASLPKTGTTWLKSLVHPAYKHRLAMKNPHDLVPFLESEVYAYSEEPLTMITNNIDGDLCQRIFATHIPRQLLDKSLDYSSSAECRVVYVTRNPKDTLISMWHFANKWEKAKVEPWQLEEAIEKFCGGIIPFGPYYDYVLGYKKLSVERPKHVFFITFEELIHDPKTHVKRLAEFLGCPFGGDDEEERLEEVVRNCSFEVLSNHEVNKSEGSPPWLELPYTSFFRKGEVGDHRNYLSDETIERIDALTKEKFHFSGFMYGI